MNRIVVDLDKHETIKSFHLWLKEQCQFPEYYGCNLDALYDCLSDNPCFEFVVLPTKQYDDYQSLLADTILDAGCKVLFALEYELSE